jgi:hypothetical protein
MYEGVEIWLSVFLVSAASHPGDNHSRDGTCTVTVKRNIPILFGKQSDSL